MDPGRTFARHLDRYRFACVDNRSFIARRVPGLGLAIALPGSVFLVGFGLWIRRGVGETPVYQELHRSQLKSQAPISEVLRLHWRGVLRVIGARIGPDVWYSLVVVFSLSYLATVLGLPRPLALISLSIGLVFNVLSEVFFGALSDRLGRLAV